MKSYFFLLSLLTAVVLFGSCQSKPLTYKQSYLVDVRTPEEFAEGSAPGAINIPLDEISQRIEEFKGKDQIVVFCRSGNRSSKAKAILDSNNIQNVVNGGTWQEVKAKVEAEK